jgi:hypothetical protein
VYNCRSRYPALQNSNFVTRKPGAVGVSLEEESDPARLARFRRMGLVPVEVPRTQPVSDVHPDAQLFITSMRRQQPYSAAGFPAPMMEDISVHQPVFPMLSPAVRRNTVSRELEGVQQITQQRHALSMRAQAQYKQENTRLRSQPERLNFEPGSQGSKWPAEANSASVLSRWRH